MDFKFEKEYYKKLVFDPKREIEEVYVATEGDSGSQGFYVELNQDGAMQSIDGLTMLFYALKPDRTQVLEAAVIENGEFRVDLPDQTFTSPGTLHCVLILRGENGESLSSKSFRYLVNKSAIVGSLVSTNERGILNRAFELANVIVPRIELLDLESLEGILEDYTIQKEEFTQTINNFTDTSSEKLTDFETTSSEKLTNFDTDSSEKLTDFETNSVNAISDFVAETNRVEALYPPRLSVLEENLTAYKEDYATLTGVADGAATTVKRSALGEIAILSFTSGLVNFDFTNNELKFPTKGGIRLTHRKTAYAIATGTTVSIDIGDSSIGFLYFDISHNIFKVYTTSALNTVTENEILVALFYPPYSTAYMVGDFLINGKKEINPNYEVYCTGDVYTQKTISTGIPNTHRIEISFGGNLTALHSYGGRSGTLVSPPAQEIGHGEFLGWDLEENVLFVQNYFTEYDKSNVIILAVVHNGVIKSGVLSSYDIVDEDTFETPNVKYVNFSGNVDFRTMPTLGLQVTFGEGKLTAWRENNALAKRLIEMPENSYHLSHNDKLIWNIVDSNIYVLSGTVMESSLSEIILIYNNDGIPKSGMLSYRYSPELEEVKKELSIFPIYAKNMLYDLSRRVKEKQKIDTLSFGFITDTHINDYNFHHVNSLGKASTLVNLDYICHGGDIINGSSEKNIELNRLSKAVSNLSIGNTPVLFCKGNHDFNDIYNTANGGGIENLLTDLELYNYTNRFANDEVVWGSREKHYFYRDDEKSKIRSVFVNTSDLPYEIIDGEINHTTINEFAFSDEQLNWIAHEALNFTNKQGWSVIIIGHRAGMFDKTPTSGVVHGWLLSAIVHSFKAGVAYNNSGNDEYGSWDINVDFSSQGPGDFIAFLRGDRHYDEISVKDGLTHITTLNSQPAQKSWDPPTPERISGTSSENAWDIVTIDKSLRKIFMTRFGAGEDREVDF